MADFRKIAVKSGDSIFLVYCPQSLSLLIAVCKAIGWHQTYRGRYKAKYFLGITAFFRTIYSNFFTLK